MNARMRAITTCVHTPTPGKAGFKRQVVFRIDADEWPLLEAAAREHGSIQAAVLAGLRALNPTPNKPATEDAPATPKPPRRSEAEIARRGGAVRVRTIRLRDDRYMHVYVVRK